MPQPSRARRKAFELADAILKTGESQHAGAAVVTYAVLELAYQVGRLADQVPVYGPPEEQP